ncbi:MAG: histidine--tRNA ligase [Chitinophagales bacterium]
MSKIRAVNPKGMRDFGPSELAKRKYIFSTIQSVFEKYGFQPIETPVMENLETLTGKYGEEGDKLLFKVLNSGDYLKKADEKALSEKDSKALTASISEKGLRYDLTIPFARYVVQNQNDIAFPFRRYQIQPVWRADRPQRGRYREFYQCDADIVGSDSLLNEVELAQIYADVFEKLGLKTGILINNRKVLAGFAEVFGVADKLSEFTVILDKLDKIGKEKVANEWLEIGVNKLSEKLLELSDEIGNDAKLKFLKTLFVNSEIGQKGIEELEFLLEKDLPVKLSLTLARGLDYYTGTIFEVQSTEAKMGSIGGGGRYDNLTEIFGLKDMSGVGISFGVERIYDIMEELDLWPESILKNISTKILFINFGGAAESRAFSILQILRKKGIASEIYPSAEKFKKQMKYADQKGIPFVAFIGEKELEENTVGVKNMESGVQESYSPDALIELLS